MSSNILADRDANAHIKPSPSPEKQKDQPKSLEYHRQVLQSRAQEEEPQFISPSDEIQSPATQKLSAFRSKHAMKKSKPQTLFQKTSSKKFESAKGGLMFADIPKDTPKQEENEDSEMKDA